MKYLDCVEVIVEKEQYAKEHGTTEGFDKLSAAEKSQYTAGYAKLSKKEQAKYAAEFDKSADKQAYITAAEGSVTAKEIENAGKAERNCPGGESYQC